MRYEFIKKFRYLRASQASPSAKLKLLDCFMFSLFGWPMPQSLECFFVVVII